LFDFVKGHMRILQVPERFRPPIQNIIWHQAVLPRLLREQQIDVLHVPSYRRLLCSGPCRLVATIHDLALFHLGKKYDWARMFYGRAIARRLAQRQDEIIATSHNTAQDIVHFFNLDRARISVIYNGVEHSRFYPGSREQAQAEMGQRFKLHSPFFLYVSRLEHPAKNHVRLISAFNQFKSATRSNWQLVLGGSDWHGADTIRTAVQQSPFEQDIRLLGFVDNADLPNLYRAAEVFVYPSLYEGFGMPPVEAMACGCPVICSNRGSLGEVVGDAAAIVNPEDVDSMAEQLLLLARNGDVREQLRTAGLTRAGRFDWNRTATDTLSVYSRVGQNAENFSATVRQKI
jgi:glycosyltransferase involved in cell wall biosynthesis